MTIEQKLAKLRIKWKNNPDLRPIIERQAKAIKYSQAKNINIEKKQNESFVADVLNNLLE